MLSCRHIYRIYFLFYAAILSYIEKYSISREIHRPASGRPVRRECRHVVRRCIRRPARAGRRRAARSRPALPAAADPAAPLVSPQWLKAASVRSGHRRARHPLGDRRRRRRGLRQGPHPGRRAQRLRQGRLARHPQRRAVHAADAAGAREADRRDRHRRGQPRRRGAGRRARDRLRLGRARLLDAQGRRPSGGVDPRRRLRRLAGGGLSGREPARSPPSPKIFTAKLDRSLLAEVAKSSRAEQRRRHAASMRGRRASSPARRRRRPPRPMAIFQARSISTAPASTIRRPTGCGRRIELASDRRARCRPARSSPIATPVIGRRPTGSCCRTCSAGTDVRLYDGSMVEWTADARRPVVVRAHALGRREEGARPRLVSARR